LDNNLKGTTTSIALTSRDNNNSKTPEQRVQIGTHVTKQIKEKFQSEEGKKDNQNNQIRVWEI
jgi:hypothetical protein